MKFAIFGLSASVDIRPLSGAWVTELLGVVLLIKDEKYEKYEKYLHLLHLKGYCYFVLTFLLICTKVQFNKHFFILPTQKQHKNFIIKKPNSRDCI